MQAEHTKEEIGKSEHILVCLSSSPSNRRIIDTASKMAKAFDAAFTALYVDHTSPEAIPEEERKRLQDNMHLAEDCGAAIVTVVGDDVPVQISEFARVSGVTKIVIGYSNEQKGFLRRKTITEQLITKAYPIDVFIIPDSSTIIKRKPRNRFIDYMVPSFKDLLITFVILAAATGLGFLFEFVGFSAVNIITVYILGVLICSVLSRSAACSLISSLCSVLLFNYYFTEPRMTLHAYEPGNYVTFSIMFIASLLTGTLANRLKDNAKQSAKDAFRAKVLFDTDRLLQKARTDNEVFKVLANQVLMLLNRMVIIYPVENGRLVHGYVFIDDKKTENAFFLDGFEEKVAEWVFENKKRAGATTDQFPKAKALYLAIRINGVVYGVIGIQADKKRPLGTFENSILLSILGECALTIENLRNEKEKEAAVVLAQKEKLRASILRTISHDLRTPLTSISGNASNLLSHYRQFDEATREKIFSDIRDDSEWLINLVENLLFVTRLENDKMQMNLTEELISDVIDEAVKHVDRHIEEHELRVVYNDELLLAEMDSKLIVQVIINLINNAIKYTQAGSEICVSTDADEKNIYVRVADNGPGMSDEGKKHAFDMFYVGTNRSADGGRGIGLGLSLCKSVIEAHGGTIEVKDNEPSGCVFTFSLKKGTVTIHE